MAALTDTLSTVDWAGWVFVALIAIGGAYLLRITHGVSWRTGDDLNRLIDGWM